MNHPLYTPEEFAEEIKEIYNDGKYQEEEAHIEIDRLMWLLLKSMGYGDAIKIIKSMKLWYS